MKRPLTTAFEGNLVQVHPVSESVSKVVVFRPGESTGLETAVRLSPAANLGLRYELPYDVKGVKQAAQRLSDGKIDEAVRRAEGPIDSAIMRYPGVPMEHSVSNRQFRK